MKTTKATFLTIILLLALLVTFWYSTNGIAYAETPEQSLETLCENYTADLKLYNSTDETETLDYYESYLETRFQLSNFHNNDRTITDEWIMRIVPKRLFEQKLRNFLYLGESYGFYFDYRNDSNVFIYFFKHDTDPYTSGQLTRRIEPFYYEMYAYNPQSGTASMQHFTDTITNPNGQVLDTQNFYRKYSSVHDVFIRDVSFSGNLSNENHLNFGDSGYTPNSDHGAYFFGGNYVFNGVSGQSVSSDLYFETLKFGLGLVSSNLGTALGYGDLVTNMANFIEDATHDFRGTIANDQFSDTRNFIDMDLAKQIEKFGGPARTFGIIAKSAPDSAASALFGIGKRNYVSNTYFYNWVNQNEKWNSSMSTRISFDIVENNLLGTNIIAENVDSNNTVTPLYSDEKISLTEGSAVPVYVFPNKICPLSFVASQNGEYTFETLGSVKNEFHAAKGTVTEKTDQTNQVLKVYLKKENIE